MSATIHIDPSANDQVTALTDTNARLKTFWAQGFVGGTSAGPVVGDPDGQVVARDGDRINLPEAAWPRLHGYFVCPSEDAIYVLLRDPS